WSAYPQNALPAHDSPRHHRPAQLVITNNFNQASFRISSEEIVDYCDSEECRGLRMFKFSGPSYLYALADSNYNASYTCKNCGKNRKDYSFRLIDRIEDSLIVIKLGQFPMFGPQIPKKALKLIGPDRDLFLKGRRAENQGLGIAAFAYYRRIVENQWQRFLDEIIKVGKKTGLDSITLQHIEDAKKERQFSKAVENMGDAIPPILKLNGQNPITLLYSALSEGIHEKSDEDCLGLAGHIRIIIYELAERLNAALQEHNELDTAVKRLASRKNPVAKSAENT
ncbi:hypothetical protein ACI3L1_14300, partial [Deinococcus sp. SM5_A1]|uniref:hypothetical protein n=1 Tax=Deinococcus sp. SM5_A1 TaxID=3379094 RepID=UPI00385F82A9